MTEIRRLLLKIAPSVFSDALDATAGVLLDIAAERAIRAGTESPDACAPYGHLDFVSDDVRDRNGGRLAALPIEQLAALEDYVQALHDRIAGSLTSRTWDA